MLNKTFFSFGIRYIHNGVDFSLVYLSVYKKMHKALVCHNFKVNMNNLENYIIKMLNRAIETILLFIYFVYFLNVS